MLSISGNRGLLVLLILLGLSILLCLLILQTTITDIMTLVCISGQLMDCFQTVTYLALLLTEIVMQFEYLISKWFCAIVPVVSIYELLDFGRALRDLGFYYRSENILYDDILPFKFSISFISMSMN